MPANPDKIRVSRLSPNFRIGVRFGKHVRRRQGSVADIEELKTMVQKLKANREKVPEELLKTKYQKPYRELLESIKKAATEILHERALADIIIRMDDGDGIVEKIQAAIDEEQKPGGIVKQISHAIFKHYDAGEFEKLAEKMHIKVWNLWIPYWQEHCCLYVLPENWEEPYPPPRIYNDLTDEFLVDEKENIWEKHPEWKSEQRTIITAGACHLLAGGIKGGKQNG